MSSVSPRTIKAGYIGILIVVVSSLLIFFHPDGRAAVTQYVYRPYTPHIPCDPNEQPGWPHPKYHHWVTENPECPGEEIHDAMRLTKSEDMWDRWPEFRNKSILICGDSVGRHLHEMLRDFSTNRKWEDMFAPGFENVHYGGVNVATFPPLGLKIAMIHTYGMANTSDPEVNKVLDKTWMGKDWDLQSRVNRNFNSTLADFVPDYVLLNSGAWEYRYWFIRDILQKQRHDDLPLEDRQTAARMAIQSMDYFKAKWPKAMVWYMHMSMMNEDDMLIKKAHGKNFVKDPDDPASYPPMYTWRRQSQYRATMRQMIADAGYDSLDYAKIQQVMSRKDFSKEDDVIHPQLRARRTMAAMFMSKVKRHVQYGV